MNQMPPNAGPQGRGVPTPVNPSASRNRFGFARTASATNPTGGTYPAGGYPSQYTPSDSPGGYTIPRGNGTRY